MAGTSRNTLSGATTMALGELWEAGAQATTSAPR